MPRENLSAPCFMTTSAVPGTVGSSISGALAGTQQSGRISSRVLQESNMGQRNSLLQALNILCDGNGQFRNEQIPGLNLFPDDLQGLLGLIHQGAASAVESALLGPVMTACHTAQLPLDVKACIAGLLHSIDDYKPFSQTQRASTLDRAQELKDKHNGLSANTHALWANIHHITDQLNQNIGRDFAHQDSAAKSHKLLAKFSANSAAASSLGTASLMAFVVDTLGAALRELSATVVFSHEESSQPREHNVYQIFQECCAAFFQSKNSNESLMALRRLEEALLNFEHAAEMQEHHSVTSPALSVFIRMITSLPFIKSLQAVNSSVLAVTAAEHALTQDKKEFSQNTQESAAKASLIKDVSGGDAVHHSQHIIDFCHQVDKAIEHIDALLHETPRHELIASSAIGTMRSHSALLVGSSLIPGFIGVIARELSGSTDFTRNDQGSGAESKVVLQTRKEMTGADLDELLSRVCALQKRLERCEQLGVSAPVVLGMGEAITSGSLIASLNVVAGMYSALRELRTLAQSPSAPLQLDEAERLRAKEYAESVLHSNQESAQLSGTGPVSEQLSLNQHLHSVMEKVVLTHRSYRNFIQPHMERNDLDSAGQSTIAFSQANSTGFLLGSLGTLALVGLQSGISVSALFGGLRYSLALKRASDGVDKTQLDNGCKSNLSFACNTTRLAEESADSSSAAQSSSHATYSLAEAAFSRSLTVALCHSGALKEMLRRMVAEELAVLEDDKQIPAPGYSDSALVSDAMMPRLHGQIAKVLRDAEAHHNPIPGLNEAMASQLAKVTQSSITAALSSHSALITPVLKSIVVAKKASVIQDEMKHEGISAQSIISQVISESLNVIQAFTINFKDEMLHMRDPIKHSSTIQLSAESIATNTVASCAVSLLCEELFEICLSRSLTLLDKEKITLFSQKSGELTYQEALFAHEAITQDSALGQEAHFSHAISALRLTLSHLGVSLKNVASEMELRPNLLQDGLDMHTAQRSLIRAMTSVFSHCSAAMLSLSALLPVAPLSSAGSVDSLRELVHLIDKELVLKPVHSSAQSSQDCGSESSLITGIGTDCVSSMLLTITKLLLQASVMGLDTSLSVAKIMEILCLHPRPDEALVLELRAMSQPNGCSANVNELAQSNLVAGSVATAGMSLASQTGHSSATEDSLRRFQHAVDQRIDQIALLDDEEQPNTLNLKRFYELLIRLMVDGSGSDDAFKEIIQRFHRGGIILSSYHSDHGGIVESKRTHKINSLISQNSFQGCDDADAVLKTFIDRAYHLEHSPNSLLDKLKSELLRHEHLSEKTQQSWEYIVSKVCDRLRSECVRNSLFSRGENTLSQRKIAEKKEKLLHDWLSPKADDDAIVSPNNSF
ncbi:hypothetical protein [Legionella worsleiensis]|uniref:Transmembrane protein n=1 Tax=Legionella worsleiensis TaxID=45076 RepID=A0A0W1AJZ5_9GAMM|nr:hypothetical protein [Legionella worsleiensis]KTD81491.1 transmembrane protein [Legionella worsleiensis]STY32050.1 transmembrane protein [Legionella worsleiensis]